MGAAGSHDPNDSYLEFVDVPSSASASASASDVNASSTSEANADECAVCLSPLERASTFTLPGCGHKFHTLCLASALHNSPFCPLCRAEVKESVCIQVADELLAQPSHGGGSTLANELLMDLRTRGKPLKSGLSDDDILEALRLAARKGQTNKIPSIAALLGQDEMKKTKGGSQQSPVVRIAAVETLRQLVPTFPSTWPGLRHVLELLRGVCTSDDDNDVRVVAMRSLREVGERGEEATIMTIRHVLGDTKAREDLRLQAADALQALGLEGDNLCMNTALMALRDSDPSVRSSGLSTLRKICVPRGKCAEFLGELGVVAARHKDAEVRCAAMELVSLVEEEGGARGIAIAVLGLHDTDEEVPHAALTALRRLWKRGDPEAFETLVKLVKNKSKDARLRCAALEVLPQVVSQGNADAAKNIAVLLDDDDGSVQASAMQALKRVCVRGDESIIALLLQYIAQKDGEVRRLSVEALGFVATPRNAKVLAALQKLQDSQDDGVQLSAQQILRQLQ